MFGNTQRRQFIESTQGAELRHRLSMYLKFKTRMIASVLKQEPNTLKDKNNAIYYNKIQHAVFCHNK